MSRRLPTSSLAAVFLLVFAGAALVPFLATPAAAFGEQPYESNTVIAGTNHLNVYSGQSVAQSFMATASYRLLNVTLRLRNAGDVTDGLGITIRPDAGGVPSTSILAGAQIGLTNNNLGNYNVPLQSPPNLIAGTQYWIVATCTSLILNNYEWHHSAADTYSGGQAKTNGGTGWADPPSPTDMYFVTYGQETDANLTATLRSLKSRADPNELVTFRVYLNDTGYAPASTAWLNDTQLPGFVHVSDTAGTAGTISPWPAFTFPNVSNGSRTFDLTARVDPGTEPGTILKKAFTLQYLNASKVVKSAPLTQASVLIGLETKPLYLSPEIVGPSERLKAARPTGGMPSQANETLRRDGSPHDFDLNPALVRSFRVTGLVATLFLDSSQHDARSLTVNLTLTDWDGITVRPVAYTEQSVTTNAFDDYQPFALPFGPIDHTFPIGGRIRFTVRNMGTSGSDAILAMNSTFAPSRIDVETSTYVRIDQIDLRDSVGSTTAWSPKDTLIIQVNVSDPFGSAEIAGARINLTAPSGSLIANFTAMALLATDTSIPSAWKVFRFTLFPPLSQGRYQAVITATEVNGVRDIAETSALVTRPAFTLVKIASAVNVRTGDRFTYDIWYNNTGTGPAGTVWINDSLPSGLTFLGSSDSIAMTGNYNWSWTSLGIGNNKLSIDVQVQGSLTPVPYFRNVAFLNFTDEKGHSWPMQTASCDVAFVGPVISLTKTSSKLGLHSSEPIVYAITMQNSGDSAQTLWVNDSLPSGLTYASDTAASIGGAPPVVSGSMVYFQFTNMPGPWSWSFTMTALAASDLVRGSTLTNTVSLNYTNANGFLLPPRRASWTVSVFAPNLVSASVILARNQVTPSDVVVGRVTYTNAGNEPANDAWVNLTFDPFLLFLNATLPAEVSPDLLHVNFTLANVPIGTRTIFLNASVATTVADHWLMPIGGTITYTDGSGKRMAPTLIGSDMVEASVPKMTLTVTTDNPFFEAAGFAFYNIYPVNAGSGVAGDVRLTLTLPASFVYVNDTSDGERTIRGGSTYVWHWTNVAPGSKSFSLTLKVKPSVSDGTRENLTFHVDYTDRNGNFRPGITKYEVANFHAARFEMLLAGPQLVHTGDPLTLILSIRNRGTAEAHRLWVTTSIHTSLELLNYTPRGQEPVPNQLNWSFLDVQNVNITLLVRVRDNLPAGAGISAVFHAVYTDRFETIIGNSDSNYVTMKVAPDITVLLWIGVAGVAAGLIAVLVFRRVRVQIEEVFLVYRDGVLIYHLSRSLSQDKDEDVLSGMLTAVQEFVRDAFVYGEHRELHQLEFGDYRIMIERGRHLYLAVVYSGTGASSVRKRIRAALDQVEIAYGSVLEKWDGDMDKVVGARDLIREYLLKPNGRSIKGMPGLP